jgi:SAM-dependent methyltransferase
MKGLLEQNESPAEIVRGEVFQRYSAYYDLLYADKDYTAEVDYVVSRLRAADPDISTLLEFGSGTGRHGRLLAARGFDVFGIERSETMAAEAQRSAAPGALPLPGRFECMHGDIRTATAHRTVDAVVSLFHVISYQTGNDDLIQTFSNARAHLRDGGLFLFDVWHGPAVLSDRPAVRVKRVEDHQMRLTRVAEPSIDFNRNIVTVAYTIFAEAKANGTMTTFRETHPMRFLFPTEIQLLASQIGFDIEATEEFATGQPASERTWGVCYVLRKR